MADVIRPEKLNNNETGAFFTAANRDVRIPGSLHEGLNFGFNTKDSAEQVVATTRIFLEGEGLDFRRLALAKQVHKTDIACISRAGIYNQADGLVTTTPGIILGIQVADCAAVLIADTKNHVVCALHAGWRGAAGHIVRKGVRMMEDKGAQTNDMTCFISPCISLKNFEVGPEVASQFPEEFCDFHSFKKPHTDLKKFLKAELLNTGIRGENIEVSEYCTMANPRFFSYRREKEHAGRMLACIYLKKTAAA